MQVHSGASFVGRGKDTVPEEPVVDPPVVVIDPPVVEVGTVRQSSQWYSGLPKVMNEFQYAMKGSSKSSRRYREK